MQNFQEFIEGQNRVFIDLGNVKVGSRNEVVFHKTPECKKINRLQTGCGCSTPTAMPDSVAVMYIPGQIVDTEPNVTTKWVEVTYDDNTTEFLWFGANVYNNLPVAQVV